MDDVFGVIGGVAVIIFAILMFAYFIGQDEIRAATPIHQGIVETITIETGTFYNDATVKFKDGPTITASLEKESKIPKAGDYVYVNQNGWLRIGKPPE